MSFSTSSVSPLPKADITLPDPQLSDIDEVRDPQTEIYQAALEAAQHLAQVVGRPDDRVHVMISGHANPHHAPREGWSDESVTISISARPVDTPSEE